MAEFGSELTQAPDITAAETPKAGVVTQVAAPADPRGAAQAFEQAASLFGDIMSKRSANKRDQLLSDFTRRQLLVADAYDQGTISSAAEARSLLRNNLLNLLESNPNDLEFATEAIAMQNKILGISGGAKVIDEKTDLEQRKEAQFNSFVDAGILRADATQGEYEAAADVFMIQQEAQRKYQIELDTINRAKAVSDLEKSEIDLLDKKAARATRNMFRDSLQGEVLGMEATMKAILKGPESSAGKVAAIEAMFTEFQTKVAPHAANLPADERNLYLEPFKQIKDLYLKLATGEIDIQSLEASNKRIKLTAENLMLQDPQLAQWAVASDLYNFGAFDQIYQADIFSRVTEIIGRNTKNPGDDNPGVNEGKNPADGSKETAKAYNEVFKMAVRGINSNDPAVMEDSMFQFDAALGNLVGAEASIRGSAKSAIDFMKVFSNPKYGEFVAKHGSDLTNVEEAARIAQEHYADEVWGMVQKEFTSQSIIHSADVEAAMSRSETGEVDPNQFKVPLSDLVTYRTTKAGMEFIAVDPNNGGAVAKARQLNKTLKPAINTTIQSLSNLQGDLDYGAAWERVASDVLGGNLSAFGGDSGDDVELSDFKDPEIAATQATKLTALIDKTEGGADYDTLFSFSNRKGPFSGTKVSDMTIGEAINFASPSGRYGQWVKGQIGRVATPMGRYQFVGTTLKQVAKEMGLSLDTKFNSKTQDALFAYLAKKTLRGVSSPAQKRSKLRGVWEGFKHVSDAELDAAIIDFEGSA